MTDNDIGSGDFSLIKWLLEAVEVEAEETARFFLGISS